MPNPIKYNNGTRESEALNSGNFSIGTNDVGKGPSISTQFLNGVTPPDGGYAIYEYDNDGAFFGPIIADNDSELITATNNNFGQTFTTVNECLNYFQGEDNLFVSNREYENIVTDGLVLNIDPGFIPSYPRNGSTAFNVSEDDSNGSMINGLPFSSNDGGTFDFDGADDLIRFGNQTSMLTDDITQEAWVNTDTMVNWHGIITNMDGWGTGFSLQIGPVQRIAAMVSGAYLTTSWTPSIGVWYHIMATHRSSDNHNALYVNGTLENTMTRSISYDSGAVIDIGCFYTGGSLRFNGQMGPVRTYNRALSSTEVSQNYNAQKARFGL